MLDEVLDDFLKAPLFKRDVKEVPSSTTYLSKIKKFVNVIVISVTPQRPKRPYIHVTTTSPSLKKVKSINGKPYKGETSNLYTKFMQSK